MSAATAPKSKAKAGKKKTGAKKANAEIDIRELERFLFHEARLLDEQRWEEWERLYGDDGEYWVPAARGQPDPQNHVSLIYETGLLRAVRIKRFRHPNAFSLQPPPRSAHLIGNVMCDGLEEGSGAILVRSQFLMLQFRRDAQDVFGGTYTHKLRRVGEGKGADGGFRILRKRVDLLNCDAPLANILLYL